MRLIAFCLSLIMSLAANASTLFLEVDVDGNAVSCDLIGVPVAANSCQAAAGKCAWDMTGVPAGSYSATGVCLNSVGQSGPQGAHTFNLPAVPGAPTGWRFILQTP